MSSWVVAVLVFIGFTVGVFTGWWIEDVRETRVARRAAQRLAAENERLRSAIRAFLEDVPSPQAMSELVLALRRAATSVTPVLPAGTHPQRSPASSHHRVETIKADADLAAPARNGDGGRVPPPRAHPARQATEARIEADVAPYQPPVRRPPQPPRDPTIEADLARYQPPIRQQPDPVTGPNGNGDPSRYRTAPRRHEPERDPTIEEDLARYRPPARRSPEPQRDPTIDEDRARYRPPARRSQEPQRDPTIEEDLARFKAPARRSSEPERDPTIEEDLARYRPPARQASDATGSPARNGNGSRYPAASPPRTEPAREPSRDDLSRLAPPGRATPDRAAGHGSNGDRVAVPGARSDTGTLRSTPPPSGPSSSGDATDEHDYAMSSRPRRADIREGRRRRRR